MAEEDLGAILEDSSYGFGWPIVLLAPDGVTQGTFTGYSDDMAQIIDPDTGQAVSGRLASISLRISSIYAEGFTELPRGISDSDLKPWVVLFNDINGLPHKFKIIQSNPDRALGVLTCILEAYK